MVIAHVEADRAELRGEQCSLGRCRRYMPKRRLLLFPEYPVLQPI
jgi:hypothetical protein